MSAVNPVHKEGKVSSLVTLGPAPFFPIPGAAMVAAILSGLTQLEFRDFGRREPPQRLARSERTRNSG
jgi:hypothetical protein